MKSEISCGGDKMSDMVRNGGVTGLAYHGRVDELRRVGVLATSSESGLPRFQRVPRSPKCAPQGREGKREGKRGEEG